MEPVVPEFAEFLSDVELHKPHTPLLSNVTGTWMTDDEATDPAMWARQIRATVRFADVIDLILENPFRVLVEVGPGGTLTGSAIRHPNWSPGHRAIRLMRHQVQNRSDRDTFLVALGQLWSAGVEVDWSPLSSGQPRRISMPGYPFARQRHWVEPRTNGWVDAAGTADGAADPSSNRAPTHAADKNGQSEIETRLLRICAECLGVPSVGLKDNFFDIGGDSLLAIGVAMSATNQGLELTPQDLYDHPSVSSLAATLVARYAEGGLATVPTGDDVTHPVPPSMAHFLDHTWEYVDLGVRMPKPSTTFWPQGTSPSQISHYLGEAIDHLNPPPVPGAPLPPRLPIAGSPLPATTSGGPVKIGSLANGIIGQFYPTSGESIIRIEMRAIGRVLGILP